MGKHTPGPWKWVNVTDERANPHAYSVWEDYDRKYHNDRYGRKICQTPDGTTEENEANARLIAKAPEMLDLLESIWHHYEGEGYRTDEIRKVLRDLQVF